MLKFILVAIAWLIYLKTNIKRKGGFLNPSSFLLLIYLVSFVSANIHIIFNQVDLALNSKYWAGVLFAFFSLLFYFYPYFKFKETSVIELKIPNLGLLNVFSIVLIIISFYSIIYWLPYVSNIFLYTTDFGELRNDYVSGDFVVGGGGMLQTIAGIGAHLYYFNIIIYFIYKSLRVKRNQQMLLLISSVSYIIYVFSAIGRDGVVFWFFTFISCYLFFRPYLDASSTRVYKRLIISVASIMAVPFIMISSSRFEGQVGSSIVSYMGQSLPNFSFYFCADKPPINYGSVFPYFCDILNIPHKSEYWIVEGTSSKSFGFFIMSFYSSLGLLGFLILEFSIVFLLLIFYKKSGTCMHFNKIILYFLFFQIFSQGVFYFRQYSAAGNILIIFSLILFIIFSFVKNPIKIELRNVK